MYRAHSGAVSAYRNSLAALILGVALLISACAKGGPPPPKDVIADALAQPDAVIVDVRTPSEFAEGHVPGAISVPMKSLSTLPQLVSDKNRQLVVHCAAGVRSARAKTTLTNMGYSKILDAKTPKAVAEALGVSLEK